MDGIQSWSSFEQRKGEDMSRGASTSDSGPGIDALYVSSSSANIAPAAASLLRHSGLTDPSNNHSSKAGVGDDADMQKRDTDEEFRLRFHWMRPHPSLAFAVEEELLQREGKNNIHHAGKKEDPSGGEKHIASPAIEASKLMEAYRSSQIKKQMDITNNNSDGNATTDQDKQEHPNPNNLPLELPKLRINLASLVEPPLMTSWLPGDDIGISDDGGDEGDDIMSS